MSIPSKEMMDWVYKGVLFGERVPNGWLDFFGSYDVEAIRKQNMKNLPQQTTKASDMESEDYDNY
jgi:hypothetical protein